MFLDKDIYNQSAIKTKLKAFSYQNITIENVDRIVNNRIQVLQLILNQLSAFFFDQKNITKADL